MTRWPGFLSPLGVWISLAALAGLGLLTWFKGPVMFSPGPLNAVVGNRVIGGIGTHAELAGRCQVCHTAPWSGQTMGDRCLACHQDVAAELRDQIGLHGKIKATQMALTCRGCHTEHQGTSAALTVVDAATFPHDLTNYSLRGHERTPAGAAVACADCHGQDLAHFDQAACTSCHMDRDASWMQQHVAAFGSQCLGCHDGVDRYGANFDHNNLAFKLEGEHAEVDCGQCHISVATVQALQQTPHDCVACHEEDDAHQGQLGKQCERCHTAGGWEGATFDHNQSAFPLTGAHTKAACDQCHANQQFKNTPTNCFVCHEKSDVHQGQFGTQCEQCHTTESWQEATFDHNKSAFPLVGAHAQVACNQCHQNNTFKGTPTNCVSCHAEPAYHVGAFGNQSTQCAACHSSNAWVPAQFNLVHTFPMDHGERGANPCRTCHTDNLQTYTCYKCHDPGETRARHDGEEIRDLANCTRCHPTGREGEGD